MENLPTDLINKSLLVRGLEWSPVGEAVSISCIRKEKTMSYSDLPELMEIINEVYGFSPWGGQDEVWEKLKNWFEGIDYLSSPEGDFYAIAEEAISSSHFLL